MMHLSMDKQRPHDTLYNDIQHKDNWHNDNQHSNK